MVVYTTKEFEIGFAFSAVPELIKPDWEILEECKLISYPRFGRGVEKDTVTFFVEDFKKPLE